MWSTFVSTQGGPSDKSLTPGKPEKGKAGEKGAANLISGSQTKPRTSCRPPKDAGGAGGSHVKGKAGLLKQDSSSPPSHYHSTGNLQFPKSAWFHSPEAPITLRQKNPRSDTSAQKCAVQSDVTEQKQPLPSVFYKHGGPSLSLFKRPKSQSTEQDHNARLYQRRGSEPGRQIVDRAATFTRARLPSDPGLKVSGVDSQGGTSEARYCLSPCATKAVRDYFSSHPQSSPQSSHQVALALVESRREWVKRCSDPTAEPDFDQLLFAEESYVWWVGEKKLKYSIAPTSGTNRAFQFQHSGRIITLKWTPSSHTKALVSLGAFCYLEHHMKCNLLAKVDMEQKVKVCLSFCLVLNANKVKWISP